MSTPRLLELRTHPLKGGRAIVLESAEAGPAGLAHDRQWLVTDARGTALTQRDTPALARISARPADQGFRFEAPGQAPLLYQPGAVESPLLEVQVWDDRITAPRLDPEAEAWFAAALARPAADTRVVRMAGPARRLTATTHWPQAHPVGFADGYPYLLMGQASLVELSARVGFPLERERFRANLWITGSEPWAEDDWGRIRIGECVFQRVKACARCVVTTLHPATLEPGPEPLRTLARYRRGAEGGVLAGQNLLCLVPGILRAGDPVIPED